MFTLMGNRKDISISVQVFRVGSRYSKLKEYNLINVRSESHCVVSGNRKCA